MLLIINAHTCTSPQHTTLITLTMHKHTQNMHVHVNTHILIDAYIYKHIHMHTHTHTHARLTVLWMTFDVLFGCNAMVLLFPGGMDWCTVCICENGVLYAYV